MKKLAFLLCMLIVLLGVMPAAMAAKDGDAPSLCTHGSNFVTPVVRPGDSITVVVEITETVTAGKGAGYVYFDATGAPLTCKRIRSTNETENSQVVAPPKGLEGKFAVIGCMDLENLSVVVEPGIVATMFFEVNADAAPGIYTIDLWGGEDILAVSGGMRFSILSNEQEPIPGVPATCTTTGLTDGVKCAFCGEILLAQQVIPLLPHEEEEIPAVSATCTKPGLTEGTQCVDCGAIVQAPQETPLLPHRQTEIPAVPATCTRPGLAGGTKCADCGAIVQAPQETPLLPHREEAIPAVPPACLKTGLTEGVQCADCGVILTAQEIIPALEHIEGSRVVVTKPGFVTVGMAQYSCEICGDVVRTEEIPALGLPGDANEDGVVDVFDALAVLKHSVEWSVEVNMKLADVTGDGMVDVFDALRILQYVVDWNVTLY